MLRHQQLSQLFYQASFNGTSLPHALLLPPWPPLSCQNTFVVRVCWYLPTHWLKSNSTANSFHHSHNPNLNTDFCYSDQVSIQSWVHPVHMSKPAHQFESNISSHIYMYIYIYITVINYYDTITNRFCVSNLPMTRSPTCKWIQCQVTLHMAISLTYKQSVISSCQPSNCFASFLPKMQHLHHCPPNFLTYTLDT